MISRCVLIKVCLAAALLWPGFSLPGRASSRPQGGGACLSRVEFRTSAALFPPGQASPHRQGKVAPAPGTPAPNLPYASRATDGLGGLLAGGFLAGLLWSLLFGYPAPSWGDGNWFLGPLDWLAAAAVFYLGYLLLRQGLKQDPPPPPLPTPSFLRPDPITPPVLTIAPEAAPGLEKITASDPQFNPAAFGDFARRVILDLHEAWSRQNLEILSDRVTQAFLDSLRLGLETLGLRGQISYLEELHLAHMEAAEAGVEGERAFITVWFQGQVVDYILDRPSRRLLSGSMTYPAELSEYWRFERRRDRDVWQLADIESG